MCRGPGGSIGAWDWRRGRDHGSCTARKVAKLKRVKINKTNGRHVVVRYIDEMAYEGRGSEWGTGASSFAILTVCRRDWDEGLVLWLVRIHPGQELGPRRPAGGRCDRVLLVLAPWRAIGQVT